MKTKAMGWLCCCLLMAGGDRVWAALSSPFPVEVTQPDGDKVTLFIRGNDKLNWYEFVPEAPNMSREAFSRPENRELARTPGYTVVRDEAGRYVFAELNENGEWTASDEVVGEEAPPDDLPRRLLPPPENRARMVAARQPETHFPARSAAPVGNVQNLVVLLRFQDHTSRNLPSRDDFDKIFNASGGDARLAPTGSVRDFYNENSYGKMSLESTVIDWITLPKPERYYADGESGLTTRVRQAITDGLNILARDQLVDFSKFDNENGGAGDGWIDAITFVHSGYGAEWGGVAGGADYKDRIWSHRWNINTWTDPQSAVKVRDYNVNPGLWSTSGSEPGRIGVICHELGHFFSLPDLYDYSGRGEGIGSWCLMANSWGFDGSQLHPPHMSAWCKVFLGWSQAQVISEQAQYKVTAATSAAASIYRINFDHENDGEYLLIENRQAVGNFDGGIPAGSSGRGGLAIWHIDDSVDGNGDPGDPDAPDPSRHYQVTLIQADGLSELEQGINRGNADDLFRGGHVDRLTPDSTPSSNAYDGTKGPDINGISASQEVMIFQLGQAADLPPSQHGAFQGIVRLTEANSHVSNFSDDGQAATLLFDRMYAFAYGGEPVANTVATFVLPLKDAGTATAVRIHIRGYTETAGEGRTTLALQAGGRVHEIMLEESDADTTSQEKTSDFNRSEEAAGKLKSLRGQLDQQDAAQGDVDKGFNYEAELTCDAPAGGDLHLTLILGADQGVLNRDHVALLWVDLIEVMIVTQQD